MKENRNELKKFLDTLNDSQIEYVLRLVKKLFGS